MYEKLQPMNSFNAGTVISNIGAFNEMDLPKPINITDIDQPDLVNVPVLVVCPGPSAKEKVDGEKTKLQALLHHGNKRLVLAGAAVKFLYDGTLSPDDIEGVIFSNPESVYGVHLQGSKEIYGVTFYVATHCKPEVFSALQNNKADIQPWNAHVEGVTNISTDDNVTIGTGYGAAIGSIALMSALGHRTFEAIGWDGIPEYAISLDDMPDYKTDLEKKHMTIEVGGQPYIIYEDFGGDVPELARFASEYPHAIKSLFIHGSGPTGKMLNVNNGPRTSFSNISLPTSPIESNSQIPPITLE